jgi:hypothetical protein
MSHFIVNEISLNERIILNEKMVEWMLWDVKQEKKMKLSLCLTN